MQQNLAIPETEATVFGVRHCYSGYCLQAVLEQFLWPLVSLIPRYFPESCEILAFFRESLELHLARELRLLIALIFRSSLQMQIILGIQDSKLYRKRPLLNLTIIFRLI